MLFVFVVWAKRALLAQGLDQRSKGGGTKLQRSNPGADAGKFVCRRGTLTGSVFGGNNCLKCWGFATVILNKHTECLLCGVNLVDDGKLFAGTFGFLGFIWDVIQKGFFPVIGIKKRWTFV